MSTQASPVTNVVHVGFSVTELLSYIEMGLGVAGGLMTGNVGMDMRIASALIDLGNKAAGALRGIQGQPIDVTKVPQEAPIP